MTSEAWVAFSALLFAIASGGGSVIWKLATNKTEILDRLAKNKAHFDDSIIVVRKDFSGELDTLRRELEAVERRSAEPVFAIREKVSAVELYLRDHYVSKREYEKDHAQLLLALKDMQEALEKRLDTYEERMEKVITKGRSRA